MATPTGEQAIGTLKVGDLVIAYDPQTRQNSVQAVEHIWINHDDDLIDLHLHLDAVTSAKSIATLSGTSKQVAPLADETVHTTFKHPFLTLEQGWLKAGQLLPGMHVIRADGTIGVVEAAVVVPGAATMYNLTISNLHTYEVGLDRWVVHNCAQTAKVKAWIKHSVYNQIRNKYGKEGVQAFIDAMNKGLVGPKGQAGIKAIKGIKDFGYQVKVYGDLGGYRLFGNFDEESGFYIFTKFGQHLK